MRTAADRRRRPLALALVTVGLFLVLGLSRWTPAAHAARAACPLGDPLCNETTTTFDTIVHETTTSLFDATPTSEDTIRRSTTTTVRRRTTVATEPTSTTEHSVTVVTTRNLLIPGDGTKGAESTTTTIEKIAVGKSGLSDDQLIVLIVAGLAVVSVALGLLTWRYWSATRPVADER